VEAAAKRYYAEIMMPFRMFIQKHLATLAPLKIDLIAPGHGPVYSRPEFILDLYRRWASDQPLKEVVIPFVSMYGNTLQMVDYLTDRLMEMGLFVTPFNMIGGDTGKLANALVDASTVVFASPAVLAGPHPDIVSAAYLMNALRPKTRFVSVIGSYGWGGGIVSKKITELLTGLKTQLQFLEPVLVKGLPGEEAFKALDSLAKEIYTANQAMDKTGVAE
jgi:flavorubredoxin